LRTGTLGFDGTDFEGPAAGDIERVAPADVAERRRLGRVEMAAAAPHRREVVAVFIEPEAPHALAVHCRDVRRVGAFVRMKQPEIVPDLLGQRDAAHRSVPAVLGVEKASDLVDPDFGGRLEGAVIPPLAEKIHQVIVSSRVETIGESRAIRLGHDVVELLRGATCRGNGIRTVDVTLELPFAVRVFSIKRGRRIGIGEDALTERVLRHLGRDGNGGNLERP
jgi:hypothetical protein